jgi:short subunit dehydrogenase-like uncharacterized protein
MTWVATDYLSRHFGAKTSRVDICIYSIKGMISGGTLASVLQAFELHSLRHLYDVYVPFSLSPKRPTPTIPPNRTSLWTKLFGLLWIKSLGWVAYQPQGPVDRAIVHRSWGLLEHMSSSYGHNFDFHAWLKIWWGPLAAMLWHFGGMIFAPLILLPFVRRLLPRLLYQPGEGAGPDKIKDSWFECRGVAEADIHTNPKPKASMRMRCESDPYIFTAIALGEAARIILWQEDTWAHKFGGGIMTPATLGGHYVSQLQSAGVTIEVQDERKTTQGKGLF